MTDYNIDSIVDYTNNDEYRGHIQNVFNIDITEQENDEFLFDNTSILQTIDSIYLLTKDDCMFQELYDKAASVFFQTDRDVGVMVLFSYDYFSHFHKCLHCYLKTPELFNETNKNYMYLLKHVRR